MLIKSVSVFLIAAVYSATAKSCGNHGAERCVSANGLGAKYVKCEFGTEVEYECSNNELCYGNGISGIMCIEKKQHSKRQSASTSSFGGYEPNINQLVDGINGNANSFSAWLTDARRAMFTNKNAIAQTSTSMNRGIAENSKAIGSGISKVTNMLDNASGQQSILNSAKTFMRSVTPNTAELGYFLTDLTGQSLTSPASRMGLATMLTNTFTTSGNRATSTSANAIKTALTNLNAVTMLYHPTTFGTVLKGRMSPSTLAPLMAGLSTGNVNATDKLLNNVLYGLSGRQRGLAGFYAASAKLSENVSKNASPSIINGIVGRYRSTKPTTSTAANVINGVANGFLKAGTRYNSQINGVLKAYRDNSAIVCPGCMAPPDCGCSNDFFTILISILVIVIGGGLVVGPSSSCCYSTRTLFTARSLMA